VDAQGALDEAWAGVVEEQAARAQHLIEQVPVSPIAMGSEDGGGAAGRPCGAAAHPAGAAGGASGTTSRPSEQSPARVVEARPQRQVSRHRRRPPRPRPARPFRHLSSFAGRFGQEPQRRVEGLVVEVAEDEQGLVPALFELGAGRELGGAATQRLPLVEDRVRHRLGQLSPRLGDADWLDGAFSAGDLMMVSVLLRLKSSGILDEYPNLAAYVARGEARPAYKRAFDAQLAAFAGKLSTG
jgi:glutathione S-transferase